MGGPEAQPSIPQSQTLSQHTAICLRTGEERTLLFRKVTMSILELESMMHMVVILRSFGISDTHVFLDSTFPGYSVSLWYSTVPAIKTSRK